MIGIKQLTIAMCGCVLAACDSNPTPHPQSDATISQETTMDSAAPNEGEYTDIDNAPDCATAGGFWDGDGCRNGVDATDTIDAAEVEVAPVGDVSDVEAGDDLGEVGDDAEVQGDVGPDGED